MSDPTIDQLKGDIKTGAGKVTGDRDLEAEGRAQSTVAGVRNDADKLMDQARDTAGDVVDKTRDVAGDVADKSRDVAGDVADKASDAARTAGDKVNEVLSR